MCTEIGPDVCEWSDPPSCDCFLCVTPPDPSDCPPLGGIGDTCSLTCGSDEDLLGDPLMCTKGSGFDACDWTGDQCCRCNTCDMPPDSGIFENDCLPDSQLGTLCNITCTDDFAWVGPEYECGRSGDTCADTCSWTGLPHCEPRMFFFLLFCLHTDRSLTLRKSAQMGLSCGGDWVVL